MYAIDTNILIYHANGDQEVVRFLSRQFENGIPCFLSTVAIVEFFSFPSMTGAAREAFESLFPYFRVVSLDYRLSLGAAELRRVYKLKLGDSIIAATALETNSTLVTRNVRDFKKVVPLKLLHL